MTTVIHHTADQAMHVTLDGTNALREPSRGDADVSTLG